MLKVFIGFDHRQPIALNVLQSSIYTRSSKPLAITPLVLPTLPLKRQGLTPFTYSRFLVPYLCDYQGWALFLDLDMIVLDDITKLFALADDKYAVMVVKNPEKFEWASLMLFNSAKCQVLTPEFIESAPKLHDCSFVAPELIGELPREWNHLVGYSAPSNDVKIIHYTQGVPALTQTRDCEHADKWYAEYQKMNSTADWVELMGRSIHTATLPDGTLVPKYKVKTNAA